MWFSICIFPLLFAITNGSRILFLLPLSASSECRSYHPLAMQLVQRGHDVTWVGTIKTEYHHSNYTELTPLPPPAISDYLGSEEESITDIRARYNKLLPFLYGWKVEETYARCHRVFQNPDFQSLVMNATFDLIFINGNLHHCLLGLVEGTPYIVLTSIPFTGSEFRHWGLRMPLSFVPNSMLGLTTNMSFRGRLLNHLFVWTISASYQKFWVQGAEAVYRSHLSTGPNSMAIPLIAAIENNVSMMFSNSHPVMSGVRVTTPDIVEIGCLQCRPAQKIKDPPSLAKWIERADDKFGIIYFCLGSMFQLRTFPPELLSNILDVLGKLRQRVVLVGQIPKDFEVPRNILVVKWAPQQDVLGHNKTRLFISHGGYNSYLEAGYHGVPHVVFPIFADMAYIAARTEEMGNGVQLEIIGLDKSAFNNAVQLVLNNDRFRVRAKEISKLFRDQPETPLERAVFWTEYTLRNGGAQGLWSSGRKLNSFQYYGLDVIAFVLCVLLAVICTLISLFTTGKLYFYTRAMVFVTVASILWQT